MRSAVEGSLPAGVPRWQPGRGQLVRLREDQNWDSDGLWLVERVASLRGVPALLLLHRSRCTATVAAARQLAMYLMHVSLSRTYAEVGTFFGRDRTTVSHACAQIEDQRDDPGFEAEVAALEAALSETATPVQTRSDHGAR